MALKRFAPMTPVVVLWEDATGGASTQYDTVDSALEGYEPCRRSSIGYYIGIAKKEGRRALLIGTDDDRAYSKTSFSVGGICVIPLGMVLDIQPITANPKRRTRSK